MSQLNHPDDQDLDQQVPPNETPDEVVKETVTERAEVPDHEDRREELRTPEPEVVEERVTERYEGDDN